MPTPLTRCLAWFRDMSSGGLVLELDPVSDLLYAHRMLIQVRTFHFVEALANCGLLFLGNVLSALA